MLSNNTNRSNQRVTIIVSAARVRAYGGRCVGWVRRGTASYVLEKVKDRFQCIWVAMIGELYELIAVYLGNRFR